jgi:hypothetical protein
MYFRPKKGLWYGILIWVLILLAILFVIRDRTTWPALVVVIPLVVFTCDDGLIFRTDDISLNVTSVS